jgi:integrase/recombinase XerD
MGGKARPGANARNLPAVIEEPEAGHALPALVANAGGAAAFAWDEFFDGQVRNPHTRRAYAHAVRQFLAWANGQGVEIARITPGMVGQYIDGLPVSPPTKKQHLAADWRLLEFPVDDY